MRDLCVGFSKFALARRSNVSIMSGVSGTLPKTRMTDEEEEHVLNLGKRESPVLVPPSINKKIETLQVSLYAIQ